MLFGHISTNFQFICGVRAYDQQIRRNVAGISVEAAEYPRRDSGHIIIQVPSLENRAGPLLLGIFGGDEVSAPTLAAVADVGTQVAPSTANGCAQTDLMPPPTGTH